MLCFYCSKDIQDVKRIVENKQKNLLELENNKRNKLYLFGHSTEAILKAIAAAHREGKFHQKPVGPLGKISHFRVKICFLHFFVWYYSISNLCRHLEISYTNANVLAGVLDEILPYNHFYNV